MFAQNSCEALDRRCGKERLYHGLVRKEIEWISAPA